MAYTKKISTAVKTKLKNVPFREYILRELVKDGETRTELKETDKQRFADLGIPYLDKCNISTLRRIADTVCVKSPTIMPKEDLINYILDGIWGIQYFVDNAYPVFPANVRDLSAIDEIELVRDCNRSEFLFGAPVEGMFEGSELGGILRQNRFTAANHDPGVIRALVNRYGLKNGDMVKGSMHYVKKAQCYCLHEITEINGVAASSYVHPAVSVVSKRVPTDKKFILSERINETLLRFVDVLTPLSLGSGLLISTSGSFDAGVYLTPLCNAVANFNEFDEVIALAFGGAQAPEVDPLLAVKCSNVVIDNLDEEGIVAERVINYAYTKAESGKNVAVIVNDLDRLPAPFTDFAHRFLSKAGRYSSGGSLTVIAFGDRDNMTGNYHYAKSSATSELKLNHRPFLGDFTVDLFGSFAQPCLDFTERERIAKNNFRTIAERDGEQAALDILYKSKSYDGFIIALSVG